MIDGQQRLTTLQILLAVLRDLASERAEHAAEESRQEAFIEVIDMYADGASAPEMSSRNISTRALWSSVGMTLGLEQTSCRHETTGKREERPSSGVAARGRGERPPRPHHGTPAQRRNPLRRKP
ncbi:hypothetical protein [Sorangium sp. So ce1389]|uniref:hypothetical protein n=1 Tax=Sorangium sp. So ce1389 TaxID=3133336 RepID=UPI003F61AAE6